MSAHDAIRMLAHGGSPTQLGEALAHYGRIFKTLHVLSYVDDEVYRRQIKGMRNLQEGRHDLARHIFHGRKGELRQAYREGMEDQLGALGLVLNCATLWNTVYLDRRPHAAASRRIPGPRRGRRPALAVYAQAHQRPGPLHVPAPGPRRRSSVPAGPERPGRRPGLTTLPANGLPGRGLPWAAMPAVPALSVTHEVRSGVAGGGRS